ncbi:hypothetical protein H5410_027814 [Solanum commersonii]|uniref:Ulp1 protease family, C-terminal catalytic domain containing protein n=1 Tax=Solanum commersonii TaxID=4109 RepID=A0A9J5Z0W8_SOLCO|nr:hypothetical protein H5410_027814 [Solanum commersonii]
MHLTSNKSRIFDSEDPNWAKLRSKRSHDPTIMTNQSSSKRKSKKEVHALSKSKDAKISKKRGRKNVYSDCGMFVAVFAKFFSDEVNIHLMISELTIFVQDMRHYYESTVSTRSRWDMLAITMIHQS